MNARARCYAKITVVGALLMLAGIYSVMIRTDAVQAFSPKIFAVDADGVPILGKSHQTITEAAVQAIQKERYGAITQQMEFSVKDIVSANAAVDKDQITAALHVDGESFNAAQARILLLRKELIEALFFSKDPYTPRIKLGEALHTIQDFYSHSNYIDRGFRDPHTEFAKKDVTSIAGVAGGSDATCDSSTHSTLEAAGSTSLTSGYYWQDSPVVPPAKCNHGGASDKLVPDDLRARGLYPGLNKDTNNPGLTSRPPALHEAAAATAEAATKKFIEELEPEIGAEKLKLLLGGDTLNFQNANASSSVTVRLKLDSEPPQTSLTLSAMQFFPYLNLPPLTPGTLHTLVVTGISSTSATGLIFYRLHLPPHLEFVEYTSSRFGGPFPLSGQDLGQRLQMPNSVGLPEIEHTIKIKVKPDLF